MGVTCRLRASRTSCGTPPAVLDVQRFFSTIDFLLGLLFHRSLFCAGRFIMLESVEGDGGSRAEGHYQAAEYPGKVLGKVRREDRPIKPAKG